MKLKKFNENFDFNEEDFDEEENNYSLKCTKKTIFHVEWGDFDRLVRDFYGINHYEFAADVESPNDTTHEFSAGKEKISYWDKKDLEKFKKNGSYNWITPTLLNDLCDEGIIEEGDYFIRVSW